jgi:hypothetical protein
MGTGASPKGGITDSPSSAAPFGAPNDLVTLGTEALGTLFRQRFSDQHQTATEIE